VRWQRPQIGQPPLEVVLEHGPLAARGDVLAPHAQRERLAFAVEEKVDGGGRGRPEPLDAPFRSRRRELLRLGSLGQHSHVDEVAQPAQRLVRPGVHRDEHRMRGAGQGEEAVDADRRRETTVKDVCGRRPLQAVQPLRA